MVLLGLALQLPHDLAPWLAHRPTLSHTKLSGTRLIATAVDRSLAIRAEAERKREEIEAEKREDIGTEKEREEIGTGGGRITRRGPDSQGEVVSTSKHIEFEYEQCT